MQKHNENLPPELERYLALCERTYLRMVEDGAWPWPDQEDDHGGGDSAGKEENCPPDSTDPDDLIESWDNSQDL